jgi:hypothetical protein
MPVLTGRELLLRMRALGAGFPILLLTGCVNSLSFEERVLFSRCLDKTMPTQNLLETISEFLDPNQIPDFDYLGKQPQCDHFSMMRRRNRPS